MELAEEEDFGPSCLGTWRTCLWNTLEYPWTSQFAQIVAFFSLAMVLVSTITFVLSTIEEFQMPTESEVGVVVKYQVVISVIEVIDHVVVIFFTLEYLLRLVVSPRKIKFVKNTMNLVDLLAILPFYVSFVYIQSIFYCYRISLNGILH